MKQNIVDIVNSVLKELEAHGLTKSTVQQYRRGFFKPIIDYFAANNDEEYVLETLESCRAKYARALNNGDIKKHHYQSMMRSINYVKSYAETGIVSFVRLTDTKQFRPSTYALSIITEALATTDLKDNFKYKLDCVLRKFFCFIEEKCIDISNITINHIRDFFIHTHSSNFGSMCYVTYSLRILLKYLHNKNISNLSFDIKYFIPNSKPKKVIAAFSEQEVAAILSQIDISIPIGKRDYAIILLACGTGLRGIDIINLKLSDINWKSGELKIVQSKTGIPITLPMSGQIRNAIADYILNGRPESNSQNVFLRYNAPFAALKGTAALDGIIDHLCIKAEVVKKPYRSFHSLRRSFGTWMANGEVPITTISQMLGHKTIDSSKPYLSFNDCQMMRCALGFSDIPLNGGVYA
jgi:integrase